MKISAGNVSFAKYSLDSSVAVHFLLRNQDYAIRLSKSIGWRYTSIGILAKSSLSSKFANFACLQFLIWCILSAKHACYVTCIDEIFFKWHGISYDHFVGGFIWNESWPRKISFALRTNRHRCNTSTLIIQVPNTSSKHTICYVVCHFWISVCNLRIMSILWSFNC